MSLQIGQQVPHCSIGPLVHCSENKKSSPRCIVQGALRLATRWLAQGTIRRARASLLPQTACHVFDPEASAVRLRRAQSSRSAERLSPQAQTSGSTSSPPRGGSRGREPLDCARDKPLGPARDKPLDCARDKQVGKALVRKLSPRVEWWPQRDSNPRFRLERAAS